MKCDDLRRAIGGISPEMIERADERPRVRRPVKVILAAAVLLGIMIILPLTVWKTGMKKPEPVPYLGDRLRSVLFLPPRGVFYP